MMGFETPKLRFSVQPLSCNLIMSATQESYYRASYQLSVSDTVDLIINSDINLITQFKFYDLVVNKIKLTNFD